MDPITAILLFYVAPGILAYGLFLGHFQGAFGYGYWRSDFLLAVVYGLLGPLGLFAVVAGLTIVGGWGYGLQFIPKRPEGFR